MAAKDETESIGIVDFISNGVGSILSYIDLSSLSPKKLLRSLSLSRLIVDIEDQSNISVPLVKIELTKEEKLELFKSDFSEFVLSAEGKLIRNRSRASSVNKRDHLDNDSLQLMIPADINDIDDLYRRQTLTPNTKKKNEIDLQLIISRNEVILERTPESSPNSSPEKNTPVRKHTLSGKNIFSDFEKFCIEQHIDPVVARYVKEHYSEIDPNTHAQPFIEKYYKKTGLSLGSTKGNTRWVPIVSPVRDVYVANGNLAIVIELKFKTIFSDQGPITNDKSDNYLLPNSTNGKIIHNVIPDDSKPFTSNLTYSKIVHVITPENDKPFVPIATFKAVYHVIKVGDRAFLKTISMKGDTTIADSIWEEHKKQQTHQEEVQEVEEEKTLKRSYSDDLFELFAFWTKENIKTDPAPNKENELNTNKDTAEKKIIRRQLF